jgi:hypothetical protein
MLHDSTGLAPALSTPMRSLVALQIGRRGALLFP